MGFRGSDFRQLPKFSEPPILRAVAVAVGANCQLSHHIMIYYSFINSFVIALAGGRVGKGFRRINFPDMHTECYVYSFWSRQVGVQEWWKPVIEAYL